MRSKRLAVVLELAQRDKDEAAQAFEQARQQLTQEQHKLQQLAQYYLDYQQAFATAKGIQVQELIKQRSFLQQLAQAQKQQQTLIHTVQDNLEEKRHAWQQAHLKHKNLADLIARYRTQEDAVLAKKDQKMLDEWFQQSRTSR